MFPSEQELQERYSAWTTHSLLSVLHRKHEYTAMAVQVARAELGRRKITTDEVDRFFEQQEQQQVAGRLLSSMPLSFCEKALFFFIWFVPRFQGGAFRTNYDDDGFIMKSRQSRFFSVAGFFSLIAVACISIYFTLSTIAGIGLLILFFLVCWHIDRGENYDLT
ncbi:MAG TPA: hypothetical protein VF490_07390 [Chryseosolibacter sp.]